MTAFQAGNIGWIMDDGPVEVEDQTPDPEAVKRFLLDHAEGFEGLARLADSIAAKGDADAFNLVVRGCHALLGDAFMKMRKAEKER